MKPAVEQAIAEIQDAGVGTDVESVPAADGGAYVRVTGIAIGSAFSPSVTWISFQITWSYPDADCYPHFMDAAVTYVGDGPAPNEHPEGNLPTSMTRGALAPGFQQAAIQVSRRSNRRDAETDSALQKLLRVIDFVRTR
jgi:hypothetical protein